MTDALGVLGQALTSLRVEAGQGLVNQGEFEAAIQLPTRADFMVDSSVVDLRDRQGLVNFEVLKPPPSVIGDVQFATVAPKAEPPRLRKARKLLDDPALESVIFSERMGEAIGYQPEEQDKRGRLADPVTRAVAHSLGIDLRHASAGQRALVQRKTREIWNAYDKGQAQQADMNAQLRDRSLNDYKAYLAKLTDQGLVKPEEDLQERERNYPAFGNLMRSQANRIILNEEITRRETDRQAFDRLLSDVHTILEVKR